MRFIAGRFYYVIKSLRGSLGRTCRKYAKRARVLKTLYFNDFFRLLDRRVYFRILLIIKQPCIVVRHVPIAPRMFSRRLESGPKQVLSTHIIILDLNAPRPRSHSLELDNFSFFLLQLIAQSRDFLKSSGKSSIWLCKRQRVESIISSGWQSRQQSNSCMSFLLLSFRRIRAPRGLTVS